MDRDDVPRERPEGGDVEREGIDEEQLMGERDTTPDDVTRVAREGFERDQQRHEELSVEDDPRHSRGSTAERNRHTP
jgi:hypothetical protein